MSKKAAFLGVFVMVLIMIQSLSSMNSQDEKEKEEAEHSPSATSLSQHDSKLLKIPSAPVLAPKPETANGKATGDFSELVATSEKNSETARNISPSDVSASRENPKELSMNFDIKRFAVDEILALPIEEKKKFLEKNRIKDPENFSRFEQIADVTIVDTLLKGEYSGDIEGKEGKKGRLDLRIEGQMDAEHFNGELIFKIFNPAGVLVASSNTSGPLDDHVRVNIEGERSSLVILAQAGQENSKMIQIFIGSSNQSELMGTYYERQDDGKFDPPLGHFVLKRSKGDSSN